MTIDTTDCEECGTLGVSIGANCPRCGGLIPRQCNRDALTIDIDQLERIVKAGDRYGHNTPGVTLELIAEVRAWRSRFPAHVYRPQDECVANRFWIERRQPEELPK